MNTTTRESRSLKRLVSLRMDDNEYLTLLTALTSLQSSRYDAMNALMQKGSEKYLRPGADPAEGARLAGESIDRLESLIDGFRHGWEQANKPELSDGAKSKEVPNV